MQVKHELKHDIYYQGHKLRQDLLNKYLNIYKGKYLNVLIYSPFSGAWKYNFMEWKQVLEYMGISVDIVYNLDEKIKYNRYNTLISIINEHFLNEIKFDITKIQNRVGIIDKEIYYNDFNSENDNYVLNKLQVEKLFNIYVDHFHPDYIDFIYKLWIRSGINVISIPFGFDPLIHYPEQLEKKYDYFFVGSNSIKKVEEFMEFILPVVSNFNGIFRGTGWGQNITELSPGEVRNYYSSTKINLNFHMNFQKENICEVNERTLIISACGGFQLCDNPKMLCELYTDKEIAIAQNGKEYYEKFIYYLNKPKVREEMAYNSMIKTYENKSSLFERLGPLIEKLN
jgi:spore maturation protein CgeB